MDKLHVDSQVKVTDHVQIQIPLALLRADFLLDKGAVVLLASPAVGEGDLFSQAIAIERGVDELGAFESMSSKGNRW